MVKRARADDALGGREVIWRPQPGPQTALLACPVFEVFYGGARGGGKTDGMLGEWLAHAGRHGKHAIGLMVRRRRTELVETIERSKALYAPLGATWHEQDKMWRMPNGARLRFAYLENDADADNYMGHNYTRVYIEEIGNFPSPKPVMKLMATLRSGAGVPVGFRATGNPGGPGHQWVKARYIDPVPGGWKIIKDSFKNPFTGEKAERERVYIPSRLTDNAYLNGPEYVATLQMSGSDTLVRAWLEGDWDIVDGAYFDCWSAERHVVRPFTPPEHWTRFRSFDWGSARPFSVGWWAVATEAHEAEGKLIPAGALVRYREWYGAAEPNVGLKLTAEQVAEGIAQRDGGDAISYSVADPAIFSQDGGPSIAERMWVAAKILFRKADNRRVAAHGAMGGWDQMRARMVGEDGRPMIYWFSTCVDSIRTIPALQHDDTRPEDVDTDGEDHAADECFVAGTMIATPAGDVPIEHLRVGDLVETRIGPRPVEAVFTIGERDVYCVTMSNGACLIGTAEHPVWVDGRGFVPLHTLRYMDMMWSCHIQTDIAERPAAFGAKFMDRYRAVTSFITATAMTQTTRRATCSVSRRRNIGAFISKVRRALKRHVNSAARYLPSLNILRAHLDFVATLVNPRGAGRQAVMTSIGNASRAASPSQPIDIATSDIVLTNARDVGNTNVSWPNIIARAVAFLSSPRIAAQSGARTVVVSVTPAGRHKVYNLTVGGAEEYFAAGVLVHNCRYACMSRPYTRPKPQPPRPLVDLRRPTLDEMLKAHARERRNTENRI